MLTWTQPDPVGRIEAAGRKGRYTITWQQGYVLRGEGYDGLPMLVLPWFGKTFDTLDKAKDHAAAIERVRAVEPEASGE